MPFLLLLNSGCIVDHRNAACDTTSPATPSTPMSMEELNTLEQNALTKADLESVRPTS